MNREQERIRFNNDCANLFDKVEDAFDKWHEELNDQDTYDRVEISVPPVLFRLLASHFARHYDVTDESIAYFQHLLKTEIEEAHLDNIKHEAKCAESMVQA